MGNVVPIPCQNYEMNDADWTCRHCGHSRDWHVQQGCPACKRMDVKKGSRHKTRPLGPWCDGKANPQKDKAIAQLKKVSELYHEAAGLVVDGRYEEASMLVQRRLK